MVDSDSDLDNEKTSNECREESLTDHGKQDNMKGLRKRKIKDQKKEYIEEIMDENEKKEIEILRKTKKEHKKESLQANEYVNRGYGTPVDSIDNTMVTCFTAQKDMNSQNSKKKSRLPNVDVEKYKDTKNANRRRLRRKINEEKIVNGNLHHDKCTPEENKSLNANKITTALINMSLNLSQDKQSCCSNVKVAKKSKEKQKCQDTTLAINNLTGDNMQPVSNSKLRSKNKILCYSNSNHSKLTNNDSKIKLSNGKSPKHRISNVENGTEKIKFEDYLSTKEVEEGLKNGEMLSGYIRVNPKDFKMSYLSNPIKSEPDILINSLVERNRALDGDLVIVKIKGISEWRSPTQKTAYVVHIIEKIHTRMAIGVLKLMLDMNKQYACFHPRDNRIPRIKIPFTDWPPLFYNESAKYEKVLFLAKIKEWPDAKFAVGTILENIGMSGDIKSETKAILSEYQMDVTPYNDEMKKYFPKTGDIPLKEYEYRLDLRKDCIFTIDPLTARDLDDAVSCKELSNGNLEVGVHISDVTHYLAEDTPLNEIVSKRATSTYMVESVYHMLPKELCMLCSLLPGEDKLAFSIFWEITPMGKVISHKFARTVINSCSQLAYEHAQMMLDDPKRKFQPNELPEIFNGYTSDYLSKVVNKLQKIAFNLRESRFDSGALCINQPKVMFSIDPASCLPLSYAIYENKECHRLIEEFMLLANITTATRLQADYPDIAFLRCHPNPSEFLTNTLKLTLEKVGIHLDVSTAGKFQKSLSNYAGADDNSEARMLVLSILSAKSMNRANYFCANNCEKPDEYWHYALNIPLYTHFTSPIRRYADVMVHRQLSGSLGYTERPQWDVEKVIEIANNCNKQKYNAKRAGELSIDLYMVHYIGQNQPIIEQGVVMEVKDNSFDVIIISSGINCRVYLNKLPDGVKYGFIGEDDENSEGKKIRNLVLSWPEIPNKQIYHQQFIALFSIVSVTLSRCAKSLKIKADLLKPILPSV